MLDDFDHASDVECLEARIFVDGRALHEFDAVSLLVAHAIELQTTRGNLERAHRDVDAQNVRDARLVQQFLDEFPLAASKVENALRTQLDNEFGDLLQSSLVQAQRLFDGLFHGIVDLVLGRVGDLFEPRQRRRNQMPAPLEIAFRNHISHRMVREPTFAVSQEFFDLGLGHVIVLVVVEHRHQHVEMREQVREPRFGT